MAKQGAVVIGGGIGGMATAALLGKAGYEVSLYEKNDRLGGKAGKFQEAGFTFDMGPSWYLMPDVFEHYFKLMGEDISKYIELTRLTPSYKVFFKESGLKVEITGDLEKDLPQFEVIEPGVTPRFMEYLAKSEQQYEIAMGSFVYKNYDTVMDFLTLEAAVKGAKLRVFSKMHTYVERYFKTPEMQKIMEYTLVFLGSSPYNTPALYSIMTHIDFNMGVFYPKGGIYGIVEALTKLMDKYGVKYHTGKPTEEILVEGGRAVGIKLEGGNEVRADVVISNADRHHTEMVLTPAHYRSIPEKNWEKKTLAPSAFIMYLGVKGRIPEFTHHNLVFSRNWEENFGQIFGEKKQLPTDPSYYVCAPSVTDATVAPKGHENLFVLVPIPAGAEVSETWMKVYGDGILKDMETNTGIADLQERIVYCRYYSVEDFTRDYNSFQGTALGLAHTLNQTAIFRPNNFSKQLKGLYFVGADTNPGIGMPMCLISAELLLKRLRSDKSAGPLAEPLTK
ncbi:phytoene desaturase family protein [soil metagenome]